MLPIDISNKVLRCIAVTFDSVREEVKEVICGKTLEYEAKTMKREGFTQGEDRLSKLLEKLTETNFIV